MRRLVVMALSFLLPFTAWMAGCRQEQAAFPGGPEMKSLAQAPGARSGGYKEAPFIPAAIDPEVLAVPDQGTFSRIQAVMDREAQLASRQTSPGLFVMPRQEFPELAQYEPLPEPVPAMGAPALASSGSATEFWSRPAELLTAPTMAVPSDVSAMMPASQPHYQPSEPLMAPETIPGVYMGLGAIETFTSPGMAPPAAPQASAPVAPLAVAPEPVFSSPEANGGWEDNRRPPFPVGGLNPSGMSPPSLTMVGIKDIPLSLDWTPMAAASAKLSTLFERLSVTDALAPLPSLTAPQPLSLEMAAKSVLEKPAMAAAISGAEAMDDAAIEQTAMGLTHMGGLFMPHQDEAPSERELYMMDFWLNKPPATAARRDEEVQAPAAPAGMGTEVVSVTPLAGTESRSLRPPEESPAEPPRKKVTLREGGRRKAAFTDIDAAIDSPPLKF